MKQTAGGKLLTDIIADSTKHVQRVKQDAIGHQVWKKVEFDENL